ncbi:MAG: acyltransferase [Chloroflexi bacterium]|nr:acyltransferase [Chloroflexota bacterium]
MAKLLISMFLLFFPWKIRRIMFNFLFGYCIHQTAKIGFSIIIPDKLVMGANAQIGHLSFCKGLRLLELGDNCIIGNLNWISGLALNDRKYFQYKNDRNPSLVLGAHSAVTSRHLFDCTDRVEIGRFSTIAGHGSQFLTHSINLEENKQKCHGIKIGDFCFVGTASVILSNTELPSYSILGAASLLNKKYFDKYYLYGGVPARPIKRLGEDWQYFQRTEGVVL